jgi:putative transposase
MRNMENIQFTLMVVLGMMNLVLRLKHYLHSSVEKSMIERVMQYFKDRIENFDGYYPCMLDEGILFHVHN